MLHKITEGKSLKCWRVAHGLTQNRMAQLMGINTSTLSDIENGGVDVTTEYLAKAEKILNSLPPKSTQKAAML